jgi:hypothetical protein
MGMPFAAAVAVARECPRTAVVVAVEAAVEAGPVGGDRTLVNTDGDSTRHGLMPLSTDLQLLRLQ